jgi:hypothetical protein
VGEPPRSAHGKIFPAIGTVRNQTRNTLVRQLASDANQTVLDHITVLEKTGAVDFDAIANDSVAGSTASPSGPPPPAAGVTPGAAPPVEATGDIDTTSRPSPGQPGTVNTSRPDPEPEDPDSVAVPTATRIAGLTATRPKLKCCSERPRRWVRPRFPGPSPRHAGTTGPSKETTHRSW